ncbi:MAG: hypothetical protein ACI89J_003715 [Hyphomicrobiaceae bacterium]|jgi:hypothetical protein
MLLARLRRDCKTTDDPTQERADIAFYSHDPSFSRNHRCRLPETQEFIRFPIQTHPDPQEKAMTQPPFEFPQQFRDLAKQNVEQATSAYNQFNQAMTSAMGMWLTAVPSNEATTGFKPVQDKAISFAQQNAEAGLAHAKELTNAKDIQEILAIQTRFSQAQMQDYTKQAQELGQLMMAAAPKGK